MRGRSAARLIAYAIERVSNHSGFQVGELAEARSTSNRLTN
jgi:hypothetical protein